MPDFRDILGKRTLKNFAKSTESEDGYRVIEHPVQRSRVVLAPANKAFQFPMENSSSPINTVASDPHADKTRTKTLDFLDCLNQLTEHERAQVVIPTAILVKLLTK